MKNKQLLLIGLLFISSYITVKAGHTDQIFAPYEKSDHFSDAMTKIGYNVLFNILSRIVQAPVDIVVPVATHVIAEKINEKVLKKAEYVKEALTVEAMKTDLEAKEKLNKIKVETANDEFIQARIDRAKASQMAIINSIKNNPDLSEEERNKKIKQKKELLEKMQDAFTARLTEDALKGSSIKLPEVQIPSTPSPVETKITPENVVPTEKPNSSETSAPIVNLTSTTEPKQSETPTPTTNPMPA